MARNDPQMNLRVPMELKEKIEKNALENGRTITAEAVYRLEKSFESQVDNQHQIEIMQTAMIQVIMAAAKVFDKKGLEWSRIQENLIEATKELAENTGNQK